MPIADDAARLVLDRVLEVFEALDLRVTPRSRLDADRLQQGTGAVLSARRAAELLPIATTDAMAWLEERGLVRQLGPARVVCWGDVLQALREDVHLTQTVDVIPLRRRQDPPPI